MKGLKISMDLDFFLSQTPGLLLLCSLKYVANYKHLNKICFFYFLCIKGHDTTSAGSSFVLCLLGIHKDIQEKVWAEQKAIFGNNITRDCTFNDTMEMKYLERVIMETLRMYPPVPLIARRVEHDVKLASGPYTIPKVP